MVDGDCCSVIVWIEPDELVRTLLPGGKFSPEVVPRIARPSARIRFAPLLFALGAPAAESTPSEGACDEQASRLGALPELRSKSFERPPGAGELLRLGRSTRRIVRLRCVSVLVSFSITTDRKSVV